MAEIKEKLKKTWQAITYPYGLDKEYDDKCDESFLRTLDNIIYFAYSIFIIFSFISIYFLITREIL